MTGVSLPKMMHLRSYCVQASRTVLRLPPQPTIRDVLQIYGIRAQKKLSQNFLMEPKLQNKIVKAAGNMKGCHVCEVGPGPGGLTRSILEKGADCVVAIEKDQRFLPVLESLADASNNRLKVILGDILRFNLENIFPKELAKDWQDYPPKLYIIGNLPFSISTPLIIRWLKDISYHTGAFSCGRVRLTLTFQKEVAERMVAPILSSKRCRLSIMCQHLCDVQHLFTISGRAFVPKPDVDVGVVRFTPLKEPLIKLPFEIVEKFMRNVFHFRQKYCKRGVEVLFPNDKMDELTKEIFEVSEVDPTTRPFQLTIEELNRMATAYYNICQRFPKLMSYEYREKIMTNVLDDEDITVEDLRKKKVQRTEAHWDT